MLQLMITNGVAVVVSMLYSYIVHRFSKSKILLFLPSILGVILFIANFISDKINPPVGIEGLAIFIIGMIVISVLIGNFIFSIILLHGDKRREDMNK